LHVQTPAETTAGRWRGAGEAETAIYRKVYTMSNKSRPARATDTEIEEAIRKTGGLFALAAQRVGVSASTITRRVAKSARLQEAAREATDRQLDLAESALMKAIEAGESWAVCFFLKCKGKGRGYIERQEITGRNGGPIIGAAVTAELTDAELDAIINEK